MIRWVVLRLMTSGTGWGRRNVSELRRLRERGKTPPAVCPCCVQAFVMLPVARELTACSSEEDPHQVISVPLAFPLPYSSFFLTTHCALSSHYHSVSLVFLCESSHLYNQLHCSFVGLLFYSSVSSFHWIQGPVGSKVVVSSRLIFIMVLRLSCSFICGQDFGYLVSNNILS